MRAKIFFRTGLNFGGVGRNTGASQPRSLCTFLRSLSEILHAIDIKCVRQQPIKDVEAGATANRQHHPIKREK